MITRCKHGHTQLSHPQCFKNTDEIKGIITPDTHFDKHDHRAYELHMRFAEDFKPDVWLHLGDMGNFDGISHWNIDRFKKQMENPLHIDYDFCYQHNKDRRRICPNGDLYQLDGNHEKWIIDWGDKYPAVAKMADINSWTGVDDFNITRIREDTQPYKIGKLYFIHGWYTNKYHANKHAQFIHGNLVYGHTHDAQLMHSQNIDSSHRQIVCSMGHLMDEKKADYLKSRPTNWMLGFGVFYMNLKEGLFNLYFVGITRYQFRAPNGVLYK